MRRRVISDTTGTVPRGVHVKDVTPTSRVLRWFVRAAARYGTSNDQRGPIDEIATGYRAVEAEFSIGHAHPILGNVRPTVNKNSEELTDPPAWSSSTCKTQSALTVNDAAPDKRNS